MLILVRDFSFAPGTDDVHDESNFIGCLEKGIRAIRPDQRIVSFDEFRRVAYPQLPRTAAPRRPEFVSLLMDRPEIKQRVRASGVRFIAFVGGVNESKQSGGITCGAGFGAGACVGVLVWHKNSRLGASIRDLDGGRDTATVGATSKGTAWFAVIGILPLGVPSEPEQGACTDLGRKIGQWLAGVPSSH